MKAHILNFIERCKLPPEHQDCLGAFEVLEAIEELCVKHADVPLSTGWWVFEYTPDNLVLVHKICDVEGALHAMHYLNDSCGTCVRRLAIEGIVKAFYGPFKSQGEAQLWKTKHIKTH